MVLEITERPVGPEATAGPPQGAREGIEAVIELPGVDAQLAEVVAQHSFVVQPAGDVTRGPEPRGIGSAEELIGHGAAVLLEPEGPLPPDASGGRQAANPRAQLEMLVHLGS